MTTGESANGRSMRALSSPRPGKRRRTRASAATIPNTVFTGTAIGVIVSVSQNADWNAGRRAPETGPSPPSKVAEEDHPDRQGQEQQQVGQRERADAERDRAALRAGPGRRGRVRAVTPRRAGRAVMVGSSWRRAAGAEVEGRQQEQRDREEDDRDGRRAGGSSLSIWPKM